MKRKYLYITTLILWIMLCFSDFLEENFTYSVLMNYVLDISGMLAGIVYIVADLTLMHIGAAKFKEILINSLIWVGMAAGISFCIELLMEWDLWIIPQATGGWEHFLNGIEYIAFPIIYVVESLPIYWLYNLIRFAINKIRKK